MGATTILLSSIVWLFWCHFPTVVLEFHPVLQVRWDRPWTTEYLACMSYRQLNASLSRNTSILQVYTDEGLAKWIKKQAPPHGSTHTDTVAGGIWDLKIGNARAYPPRTRRVLSYTCVLIHG